MSLHGRTALVTGSTSGIGLGIAEALAAAGANLMLNGFGDADTIAALQNRLATTHGVRVRHHGADVSKPAECEALIAETATQLGAPAILVNNAGIQHTAPIEDFPTDRWDAIIAINLSSAFHTLKAAIPPMRAAGWGRIVNIASAHGLVASPYKSAYVAAKHGIVGLSKVAALELANTGITCNAICPGWALTPLVQKQLDIRAAAEGATLEQVTNSLLTEKQPLAQFTTPDQIGALVVFLCTDAASTITGASLSMDGGWTAR